ncbi:MAG: carboxypeptidase-like regulatory domain-containing protein [Vicinamibacterales bacterium]
MPVRAFVLLALGLSAAASTTVTARQTVSSQVGQGRDLTTAAEAPRTGSILGVVTESGTGQPVGDVRVRATGSAVRGSQTAITDEDGRFAFAGLAEGTVTLSASKAGYVGVSYGQSSPRAGRTGTPIAIAAGQSIRDLKFEIPKGGVITGLVFDEKNRPSVGTPVRVMRWTMSTGEPTLASAGSATTDDRGMYRVYGLPPGEYLVSAMPRTQMPAQTVESAALLEMAQRLEQMQVQIQVQGSVITPEAAMEREMVESMAATNRVEVPPVFEGYAPVYYPGTTSVGGAALVPVGVSEEHAGVDFALVRTTLARVEGQVLVPSDGTVSSVQVRLTSLDETVPGVSNPTARAGRDGRFTFNGVAPGRYRATAVATVRIPTGDGGPVVARETRATGSVVVRTATTTERLWATADVVVAGAPVSNVTMSLRPGLTVTGRLDYDGVAPVLPANRRVRVSLTPDGAEARATGAASVNANVEPDGRFTLTGIVPARYRIQNISGVGGGWTLQSAMTGGRDALDFGLDVTPDGAIADLAITLTQKTSSVNGAIQTVMGAPTADYTVIIFPADRRYWAGSASRRIRSARPSTDGQFAFSSLPAGEYRLAAVLDVEYGQWYDPSFLEQLSQASVTVSLAEGQTRTQDIRVAR